jgi:hypothetical protein
VQEAIDRGVLATRWHRDWARVGGRPAVLIIPIALGCPGWPGEQFEARKC